MESLNHILGPEDKPGRAATDTTRQESLENRKRMRFWRKRDPLYLTAFNERRMEHYGRVAYANLRYGRRLKGIPGWRTDRGKTHIKYGWALKKKATRLDMGGGADALKPSSSEVRGGDEMWFYDGFSISFVNSDGPDGWRFDTRPGRKSSRICVQSSTDPFYRTLSSSQIQNPIPGRKLQGWGQPPRGTGVCAAEIQCDRIGFGQEHCTGERRVSLFNEHWDEVYRKTVGSQIEVARN